MRIVGKKTQAEAVFRFWQKSHKLAWRHIVVHCFSIYDAITSKCRIFVSIFHGEVITPNLEHCQVGYGNFSDSSKLIKPLEIFSTNNNEL